MLSTLWKGFKDYFLNFCLPLLYLKEIRAEKAHTVGGKEHYQQKYEGQSVVMMMIMMMASLWGSQQVGQSTTDSSYEKRNNATKTET